MISYKYNIYYSKKTKYLDKMLRECCFVWNHALALQRRYYRMFGKYISVNRMQKHFSKRINRNLLHSQTVQEILHRLDSSYNRFFKKLAKRPPKFKSPEKGVRAGAEAVRKSAWDAFRAQCPHIAFPYGKEFPMCDDHEQDHPMRDCILQCEKGRIFKNKLK